MIAAEAGVLFLGLRVPVTAEPCHTLRDGVDELLLFLLRIGVVKAQMKDPRVGARERGIKTHRLGVPDMKIAVGLRWETRAYARGVALTRCSLGDSRAAVPSALQVGLGCKVLIDHAFQEIAGGRFVG
jgi:hypothetical protein